MAVQVESTTVTPSTRGGGGNPPLSPALGDIPQTQYKNEILILISAPLLKEDGSAVEALSIQREIDGIVSALEDIPDLVEIVITVKIATTESILQFFANAIKPLIIHFIGHGMSTDNGIALLLEDKVGKARPFTSSDLRNLLGNRTTPPCQLALLNACHSQGLADEFLRAGVPHVIAINAEDKVLSLAAQCFAKHLYHALFNNNQVVDAFLHGRNAVKVNDDLAQFFNTKTFQKGINLEEVFKFHLLPTNAAAHNKSLELLSLNRGQIITPNWENTNLRSYEPTFVGRRIDIHRIAMDLIDEQSRCVALHGIGGMGKTALAQSVGRWQHERRRWRDGVWLVELRNVESIAVAITKIVDVISLWKSVDEMEITSLPRLAQILNRSNILLILDDLDELIQKDYEGLSRLLNALLDCSRLQLLVTSRLADLPSAINFRLREVQELEAKDAKKLFENLVPRDEWGVEAPQEDYDALMTFLDGYPFPIHLVASYMKKKRCTLRELCQRLQIDPLMTLRPTSSRKTRDNSLDITLELSYNILPLGAREIFPLLALFPSGLTDELAKDVLGEDGFEALETLVEYSMAERKKNSSSGLFVLPEPARHYAETKQEDKLMERIAPKVLKYFYVFAQKVNDLLVEQDDSKQAEKHLKEEQANLLKFLEWGYQYEKRGDGICRSARITALLGKYWKWVAAGKDPMTSLNSALQIAQGNRDILGEADIQRTVGDIQFNRGLEIAQESYRYSARLYESVYEKIESNLEKANTQRKLGEIWRICQEEKLSLSSYLKAFQLYELAQETLKAADIKMAIGELQQFLHNLESTLESYQEAKQLYQTINHQSGIIKAENCIRYINKIISSPELILNSFTFETITLNSIGKIIHREERQSQNILEDLGMGVTLDMVSIPAGSFLMGSLNSEHDDEHPQHKVILETFCIGKYPITQEQWRVVSGLPKIKQELNPEPSYFNGDKRPVEGVSWLDAIEFCRRLSKHSSREYRLPSEAEWEYACRAGTTTPFHFGETITTDDVNYYGDYPYGNAPKGEDRNESTDVGSFKGANAFGLYDMHGNVWEWCADDWHNSYEGAPKDGSVWIKDNKNYENIESVKLLRGGSWGNYARNCRSAYRFYYYSPVQYFNIGFRVVCVLQ
jgi:formylglycine-generating enzyme required for sulfatase activity/predicted ATPase